MVDWITLAQNTYSRLRSPWMFSFRPDFYTREGLRPDPLRDKQTRLGLKFGTRWFSRSYDGVPGRIHIHEQMLQDDSPAEIAHYISVGRSAMANLDAALKTAGLNWDQIGSVLDMACGYGRVLRWLAQKVPAERITACEVMPEAIKFLHQEFGAKPLLSPFDLSGFVLPEKYDLIWVGSLFTHLVPADALAFIEKLVAALNPRGILVFSTQGPSCLVQIPEYGFMFEDKTAEFRRQLETTGAAYLPYYDHTPKYGITLFGPDRIRGHLQSRFGENVGFLAYNERGWDNHQDVYVFQRLRESPLQ